MGSRVTVGETIDQRGDCPKGRLEARDRAGPEGASDDAAKARVAGIVRREQRMGYRVVADPRRLPGDPEAFRGELSGILEDRVDVLEAADT